MNYKPLKRISKSIGLILLVIILLLVLFLFVGLKTTVVQKQIGRSVSNYLSKKTATEVDIDRVVVHLFDRASLHNAYFEDSNQDTLLSVKNLVVNIDLVKLLKRKIEIDNVFLGDATINLVQNENKEFNFQYFIDAFTPKKSNKKKKKKPAWEFSIKKLELNNNKTILDLISGRQNIELDALNIDLNSFDIKNLVIDANDISIESVNYSAKFIKPEKRARKKKFDPNQFPLYSIPIKITSKRLRIKDSYADIITGPNEALGNTFNPQRIFADSLNINFTNVYLDSTKASVKAKNISTQFGNYIDIENLSGDLLFANNETSANNLAFKTKRSLADMDASLAYDEFKTFLKMANNLNVDISGKPIKIHCAELFYFIPSLRNKLDCNSLPSNYINLNTEISGNLANLNIKKLELTSGSTKAKLKGSVKNISDINKLQFSNLNIQTNSNANEIEKLIGKNKLPFDLQPFGNISILSKVNGTLNNLMLDNLEVSTDTETELLASGNVSNITNPNQLSYQINIEDLSTSISDLSLLIDSLPSMANKIDYANYSGQLNGNSNTFDIDGTLTSNLGSINPDLLIEFNNNFTDAQYKGDININQFNLGELLDVDSIGFVTMSASLDGNGLALNTINTKLDATISSLEYNGYKYNDLKIDGKFNDEKFNGNVNIDNDHIAISFDGEIGTKDDLPDFDFNLKIDSLNLKALNLSETPLIVSADITSKLKGQSIDDLLGGITVKNIHLINADKIWETDSLVATISELENGAKSLTFTSEILSGSVIGNYKTSSLLPSVVKSLDTYFPIGDILKVKVDSTIKDVEQDFEAKIYLNDVTELAKFIDIPLKHLDTAALEINYNSIENKFDVEVNTPKVIYNNIEMRNIAIEGETKNDRLTFNIDADSVEIGKTVFLESTSINTSFKDGKGTYVADIKDENGDTEFAIGGDVLASEDGIDVKVNSDVILDGEVWGFTLKEPITIGGNVFNYPAFNLIREDQGILLSKKNEDGAFELYFESFEASNITNFILNDSVSIDGSINGTLLISPDKDPMTLEGDLFVSTIEYNGVEIGNLGMIFENIGGSFTTASIILSDLYTDVQIEAILSENQSIDAEININQFDIKAIEPFVDKFISEVEGGMEGYVTVGGSLKAPEINGLVDINNVKARINSLGSIYEISEGHIEIEKDKIYTDMIFIDSLKRTAHLSGKINHQYFSDLEFDLNLNAKEFTFLDTKRKPNIPFYGVLNAELDADLTGTLKKPEIFAVFATSKNSDIKIDPYNNASSIKNEDYVIFVDGKSYNETELDSIIKLRYDINTIFDLTLYANINDSAKLSVIIDPISGDKIEVEGNGNMVVDVTESGELLVNGSYIVEKGLYTFTYQDIFLKKGFDIRKGGEITFVGDIMDSKLDISAAHSVKTSTYSLVQNEYETLSESEKESVKKPIDVDVFIGISGDLSEPALSFGIELPEATESAVSSAVVRALDELRTDNAELNTQVFSLLLLGSFKASTLASNAVNTGTQIAYNSLTGFINNQLKKLTSKAKGLEVGVGVASSSDETLSTSTNIDAVIKYTLLNDRLSLQLGGNVDLNSGNSEGSLSNVAGDFVLEYKLTKDGNLRLNVFQKSDYDLLNDNNVWKTGAGLSYQKTFGKLIKSEDGINTNHKLRKKENRKQKKSKKMNKTIEAIKNELDSEPINE